MSFAKAYPVRARSIGILVAALLAGSAGWALTSLSSGRGATFLAWGRPGREKPGFFDRPRCVAIAPDGTLYVLDLTGRIQHFTPAGEYLDELQMPDVSVGRPQGIDVGPDGCVYVADTHYNRVVKFAPSGEIRLIFGQGPAAGETPAPGELFWPCAIVVAEDGTIFTTEYGAYHDRVQVWSPAGGFLRAFGAFGTAEGQFMRPMGLALDRAGHVYVADAVNHRVQVFTREGRFVCAFGGQGAAPGRFRYPYDIAVDSAGVVYTVEYGGHRVQRLSPAGEPRGHWGGLAGDETGLSHPWGLDVTPAGTVYVCDTRNCRVVRAPLRPKADNER